MEKFEVNPDHAQLVEETDSTYRIYHPNLGKFDIAKSALEQDTHGFIKNLKPQKMADGGKVKKMAFGTDSEDLTKDPEMLGADMAQPDLFSGAVRTPMGDEQKTELALSPLQKEYNLIVKGGITQDPSSFITDPNTPPENYDPVALQMARQNLAAKDEEQKTVGAVIKTAANQRQQDLADLGFQTPAEQAAPAPIPEAPKQPEAVPQPAATMPAAPDAPKTPEEKEIDNAILGLKKFDDAYTSIKKDFALRSSEIEAKYKAKPEEVTKTLGEIGNKVLGAISLMLGGISQGILKTPTNPAMDVINRSIEKQLAKEKMNMEREDNELRRLYERYGNEAQAIAARRSDYLTAIKIKMEQQASKMKMPTAMMEMMKNQIELQNLIQKQHDTAAAEGAARAAQTGQPLDLQQRSDLFKSEEYQKRGVELEGGRIGLAKNPEARKELEQRVPKLNKLESSLNALESLLPKGAVNVNMPFGAADAKEEAAVEEVRAGLMGLEDTHKELKSFEKRIPKAGLSVEKTKSLINNIRGTLASERKNLYKQYLESHKDVNFKPGLPK